MEKGALSPVIVESYKQKNTSGLRGAIYIKPIAGQEPFTGDMHLSCSKVLCTDYQVKTKFIIKAKITSKEVGKSFDYSHYSWPYVLL
jgi:hypothetical protein